MILRRGNFTRSEEHTSELSHLVISYAVFCLKKTLVPRGQILLVIAASCKIPSSGILFERAFVLARFSCLESLFLPFFFFESPAPPEFSPLPHHPALRF